MIPIAQLWLPILVSAAAVWVASAIIWMAMPHHKNDYSRLPDETRFSAAVGPLGLPPGTYGFPFVSNHDETKTPEFKKQWTDGPRGHLSIWPEKVSMARNMLVTFAVFLVVSGLIGYIGSLTLAPGAGFSKVLQVLGTAGVLSYCFAFIPNGVWFGQSARTMTMHVLDGVLYGLGTGAVFAAMWPK